MKERQLVFNQEWWTLMVRLLDRDDRVQLLENLMHDYFEDKEPESMSEGATVIWDLIQKALKERSRIRTIYERRNKPVESTLEKETRK